MKPRQKGPRPKPKGEAVYKQNRVVVFLDDETHRMLKVAAALEKKPMSIIVRAALQKHLKELKGKMPSLHVGN